MSRNPIRAPSALRMGWEALGGGPHPPVTFISNTFITPMNRATNSWWLFMDPWAFRFADAAAEMTMRRRESLDRGDLNGGHREIMTTYRAIPRSS